MNKIIGMLLTLTLLCGCGAVGETNNLEVDTANTNESTVEQNEETTQAEPNTVTNTTATNDKVLVVYFSHSGNTKELAEKIHSAVGGDIYELKTKEPYTDNYNDLIEQAKQEQADNFRPELEGSIDNIEDYDVVFLGYPNWWSDLAMPMFTFLDEYDLSGKTVIPFCTSGGGGFGNSVDSIKTAEPNADIKTGLHINGDRVDGADSEISAWLKELGF